MFAEQGGIKYLGIVSNDFGEDAIALVRWHYRKAGCIEVVHDVVKNELGGGVLPCATFGANAAWFRLCLVTYNLLSAMKVLDLPPPFEDARPKRLRFAVFNLPGRLVSHAQGCWPVSAGVFWNAPICCSGGRDCAPPGQGSRAFRPVERPPRWPTPLVCLPTTAI